MCCFAVVFALGISVEDWLGARQPWQRGGGEVFGRKGIGGSVIFNGMPYITFRAGYSRQTGDLMSVCRGVVLQHFTIFLVLSFLLHWRLVGSYIRRVLQKGTGHVWVGFYLVARKEIDELFSSL